MSKKIRSYTQGDPKYFGTSGSFEEKGKQGLFKREKVRCEVTLIATSNIVEMEKGEFRSER